MGISFGKVSALLGCEVVKFWSMFPVKIHVEHDKKCIYSPENQPKTNMSPEKNGWKY